MSNMGYDGIPIVKIIKNKYLIGAKVQYLTQHGNLIVVQDRHSLEDSQTPLSQFLADNIVREVRQIENLMQIHSKGLVETVQVMLKGHRAPAEIIESVQRQVDEDRFYELL